MSKLGTFGFHRDRISFDGDSVGDVLSYYFPEWTHNNGRPFFLGAGLTSDRREVCVYINTDKSYILRLEVENDYVIFKFTLSPNDKKDLVKKLWRFGDVFKADKSDFRFFQLMKDYSDD